MVGSGKKAVSRPERPRAVCVLGEGATISPHPNSYRGLPSGVWGAVPAEIEFGAF